MDCRNFYWGASSCSALMSAPPGSYEAQQYKQRQGSQVRCARDQAPVGALAWWGGVVGQRAGPK